MYAEALSWRATYHRMAKYKRPIKGQCDEHKTGRMVEDETGEEARDLPMYSLLS